MSVALVKGPVVRGQLSAWPERARKAAPHLVSVRVRVWVRVRVGVGVGVWGEGWVSLTLTLP